jgi:ElaB/YqjD/DUF883 family membrane-anchored ribosome-binding protein
MDLADIKIEGNVPNALQLARVLSQRIEPDQETHVGMTADEHNAVSALVSIIKHARSVDLGVDEALRRLQTEIEAVTVSQLEYIPYLSKHDILVVLRIFEKDRDLVVGALLFECRYFVKKLVSGHIPLTITIAILQYLSGGMVTSDVGVKVWQFQTELARLKDQNESALHNSASEHQATISDQRQSFEVYLTEKTNELQSFKDSLSEEIKIRSATTLWSDRAFWHRVTTAASLGLFLIVVGVSLYQIKIHFSEIVQSLPKSDVNNGGYSGIVLLVIPAIGIGWVLKMLARLVHTNSNLGDDARQRQAMVRTYLALVADKESAVTETDRLVMLNAIFRPLPGGQNDEVAPPTILDLIKKN